MMKEDIKIEGVELVDDSHFLLDLSDGRTLKYSAQALRKVRPISVEVVLKESGNK